MAGKPPTQFYTGKAYDAEVDYYLPLKSKFTMKMISMGAFVVFGLSMLASRADNSGINITTPAQMVRKVLQDPHTRIVYYLESDRHHLSAIKPDGTLLWTVDTWAHLTPEMGETVEQAKVDALINFIDLFRPDSEWGDLPVKNLKDFLTVSFNSRSFSLINKSTGEIQIARRN